MPQLTLTVGSTVVTAALLTPAAVAGDGPVILTVPTGEGASKGPKVAVAVSPSTLKAIFGSTPRGVVISMASSYTLGESLGAAQGATRKQSDGGVAKKLSGAPVSINLKDIDGNPIHVAFEDPLNISMGANASSAHECVFWNESLNAWSNEGVFAAVSPDGSIICATTHLSVFGSFPISDIASAITCLSFDMFNNFDKLLGGAWIPHVGTISFFVALLMQLVLVLIGFVQDRQNARSRDLYDFFIVDHDIPDPSFSALLLVFTNAHVFFRHRPRTFDSVAGIPSSLVRKAAKWIMLQCMGLVLGHKAGLHGLDLEVLHKLRKRKKPYYVQTPSDRVQNGLTFIKFRGRHEFDRFCEQGLVSRTWTLFKSIHVFSMLSQRFSLFMTSRTLADLFALKFIIGVFFSSWFFYSESAAEELPPDDPCAPKDYGLIVNFLRGFVVATCCSIPSSLLILFFAHASMRKFASKREAIADSLKMSRANRRASLETFSLYARNILISFMIFFICLILASISPTDQNKWGFSFMTQFVQQYLTVPLATAAVMAWATRVAELMSVDAAREVRAELGCWADRPGQTKHIEDLDDSLEQEATPGVDATIISLDNLQAIITCVDGSQPSSPAGAKGEKNKKLSSASFSAAVGLEEGEAACMATNQRARAGSLSDPWQEAVLVRSAQLSEEAEENRKWAQHWGAKADDNSVDAGFLLARLQRKPPGQEEFTATKTPQRSQFELPRQQSLSMEEKLGSRKSQDQPESSPVAAFAYEEAKPKDSSPAATSCEEEPWKTHEAKPKDSPAPLPCEEEPWEPLGDWYQEEEQDNVMLGETEFMRL